jgi:hypothetical protein
VSRVAFHPLHSLVSQEDRDEGTIKLPGVPEKRCWNRISWTYDTATQNNGLLPAIAAYSGARAGIVNHGPMSR